MRISDWSSDVCSSDLNLVSDAKGGLRWRLNLDAIDAGTADLIGWPEPPAEAHYDGPTLFVAGGNSPYVGAADAGRIEARFPQAERVTIPGAGHWVHFEQPEAFLAAVRAFLDPG